MEADVDSANFDRPRERLWRRGVVSIGDEELLSIVLGTGVRSHPAIDVASELVRAAGGVVALSRASPREIAQVMGIGNARAARIAAAFELGRRALENENHRETLSNAEDVYRYVGPRLTGLAQEVFVVIGVDVRNGMLDIVEVARGSVATVEVHPREVFRPLVRMAAAGGVLVHNHPTGDPTPSHDDVELTRRLRDVGTLLGIPIIDHVVIGHGGYRSVAEWIGTVS
jgi:DNA repair protein RadC